MTVKNCPKCGQPNLTHSAWCEKCLTVFKEYGEDQTLVCPECHHPNSYTQQYCEVCHEPLKPGQWE